jgi:hypothetical protein
MPVDCSNTNALAAAACSFQCLNPPTLLEVQTYLLAIIAGGTTNAATLQDQARAAGFCCLSPDTLREVQAYLLCQIVNK